MPLVIECVVPSWFVANSESTTTYTFDPVISPIVAECWTLNSSPLSIGPGSPVGSQFTALSPLEFKTLGTQPLEKLGDNCVAN